MCYVRVMLHPSAAYPRALIVCYKPSRPFFLPPFPVPFSFPSFLIAAAKYRVQRLHWRQVGFFKKNPNHALFPLGRHPTLFSSLFPLFATLLLLLYSSLPPFFPLLFFLLQVCFSPFLFGCFVYFTLLYIDLDRII